ncbi:2-oxoacid:acceptor oxidoreductase family protein [Candidatus Gracilibacteria bacterium]|nr:2-oxoacid:acceptor oxidoreductase family protein [Candidatus Gracilibacteria bacterium]
MTVLYYQKTMRGVIRVCGAAGLGMNSTADIIADIFAELGYLVNTDIEYQSLIKGGVNYFDIFFSDESKYISKYHDILLALDTPNLKHSLSFLKSGGIVITNSKNISKLEAQGQAFDEYQVLSLDIEDKYDNTYLISILGKLLNFETALLDAKIEKIFAKKGPEAVAHNLDIRKNIYESCELSVTSPFPKIIQIGPAKALTYGNKVLADGATASKLEYYSAYPMTPASTILSEIIKGKKVQYLQAEDEISVVMSALGASFAGKRSMVGTSGGGFALMVEGISFAIQSEIPLVMVLSQRAGPSTGTPTFHEQGDLNLALNPSFGDFEHIVIAPSSLEDGYYLAGEALNLAQKYQTIVILLTDKQYADGKATLAEIPQAASVQRGKLETTPAKDSKRYALTEDGISPYTIPGTPDGDFIATSYEHDEYGATTEETDMKKAMTEKRWKKLENFYEKEGICGYEMFGVSSPHNTSLNSLLPGEMKQQKVIITTSYTSYTAKEFVKNNPEFGLIIIKYLKPLDRRLRDELIGKSEVIFVESNYSGQLEKYITQELGLAYIDGLKISNLRKYDLYPFYYKDFETLKI